MLQKRTLALCAEVVGSLQMYNTTTAESASCSMMESSNSDSASARVTLAEKPLFLPREQGSFSTACWKGPDYVRDYRPKLPDCTQYVGERMPSHESTSEVKYLCRAAPGTPAPLPKACYVGGIGWGVSEFTFLNRSQLRSNYQIKEGEFRRACEDKVTHRYQNPWHPLPHILDTEGPGSRATLAWTQVKYDDYCCMKGHWTSLHERSKTPTPIPGYLQQDISFDDRTGNDEQSNGL